MRLNRRPTKKEFDLLVFLINKAGISLDPSWKETPTVRPMNDGGMGSLLLFPDDKTNPKRKFGEAVSEVWFKDKDGIDVSAQLNLDEQGKLFELDIWKVNFDKLIDLPNVNSLSWE